MTLAESKERLCKICESTRGVLVYIYKIILKLYVFIFARPAMQSANYVILRLAMHGAGYDNCCDPEDTGEGKFIRIVAKHKPILCLDIGASVGDYTEVLLSSTTAKIISFEPLPSSFTALKRVADRFPGRCVLVNKGVGDVDAKLELNYGSEESRLASFSKEVNNVPYVGAHNTRSVVVDVIKVDTFWKESAPVGFERIDLVKIDTEGYEYEVILGARETIGAMKPKFIQIEYNWHQLFKDSSLYSISMLLPGYQLYKLLPHGSGMVKVDPKQPESNIFRYSNFVFVRDDVVI
jgi:FkbM family methyltransferase